MAEQFQKHKVKVVALITRAHAAASKSKDARGKKLEDFADLVLDTGAPVGDAMVRIENLREPVAPGSTVGGAMLINSLKAEVAQRLARAGQPPAVLTAGVIAGEERAKELFEAAYDDHAHRLARLYQDVGRPKT